MVNDSISFSCPACGIKLTVPASLAGVTGPCPSCRSQIQAPVPAVQSPMPSLGNEMPPPPQSPPQPQAAPATTPGHLKPEPRQLPQRTATGEVNAKPMPEPGQAPSSGSYKAAPVMRHPHKNGVLVRCFTLLVFLTLSGALVYGVLTFLKNQGVTPPIPTKPTPKAPQQAPLLNLNPPPKPPDVPNPPPSLPTPKPAQPEISAPPPTLPPEIEPDPVARRNEAMAILEKFLMAKTLAEREPWIETNDPKQDFSNTCLAGPLPPARTMTPEFSQSNPAEDVHDYFHKVDFGVDESHPDKYFILVRIRGKATPKIVVDPFLDLFGGRLAAYASKPSDKAAYFQVIAYAIPHCTDPTIPYHEKKQTLRFMATDNGKEITKAYFGKQSKIAGMLEDGSHDLTYGNAKVCTVMLYWNTEDNADHPYLEAGDIKACDWNP